MSSGVGFASLDSDSRPTVPFGSTHACAAHPVLICSVATNKFSWSLVCTSSSSVVVWRSGDETTSLTICVTVIAGTVSPDLSSVSKRAQARNICGLECPAVVVAPSLGTVARLFSFTFRNQMMIVENILRQPGDCIDHALYRVSLGIKWAKCKQARARFRSAHHWSTA